jgi:hypothetical protein
LNSQIHYSVQKGQPLVPALSQANPDQNLTQCFFKIHYSSIYAGVFQCGLLPSRFPTKISVCISHLSPDCCTPHQSHSPWSDQYNIWQRVQIIKFFITQFSPASRYSQISQISVTLTYCLPILRIMLGKECGWETPPPQHTHLESLQWITKTAVSSANKFSWDMKVAAWRPTTEIYRTHFSH